MDRCWVCPTPCALCPGGEVGQGGLLIEMCWRLIDVSAPVSGLFRTAVLIAGFTSHRERNQWWLGVLGFILRCRHTLMLSRGGFDIYRVSFGLCRSASPRRRACVWKGLRGRGSRATASFPQVTGLF